MNAVIIDRFDVGWQKKLEEVVFTDQEATLLNYDEGSLRFCVRLAGFTKLLFEVDAFKRTISFRKRMPIESSSLSTATSSVLGR